MNWSALLAFVLFPLGVLAQQEQTDTVPSQSLPEVVVKGYEQNRRLLDVAAPIGVVNQQQLQRFNPTSVLPAVNTVPGVRMEERSPASYRLNIRGSSLRSPFGVRNVKVYWNDIPFTDPGGNTYLNQLSAYNFSSLEILKGPGSSLYGAGTGGVMLINSFPAISSNRLSISYARGSYGSDHLSASVIAGTESFRNQVSYTHQTSDGYRQQSAMRRDVVSWETHTGNPEKQELSTQVLYGDLYYQTPGALTLSEYQANPKAARPAAGGFPSAVQNGAAIYQKTFWSGLHYGYHFNEHWQNSSSVYGAFTQVRNPAVRNYERRLEPNFGGRTTFSYNTDIHKTNLKIIAGAEAQQGYATIKVYKNKLGQPDSLQTDDEVASRQLAIFSQAEISFSNNIIVTAGLSLNKAAVSFNRLSVVPSFVYTSHYNSELAPRISLLKKMGNHLSLYALVSKGFSPPTVAELLPSTSVINTGLQAEQGVNWEAGAKSAWLGNRLQVEVNAFYFRLKRAITQRRDASGADYFINTGRTKQQGVETAINYQSRRQDRHFFSQWAAWLNHTGNYFRYQDFKQLTQDFSGRRIPGVATQTLAAGLELRLRPGFYANANYFYSSRIALNDANSAYAMPYHLLGSKAGYRHLFGEHLSLDLSITGDNLLNENYSLGNDINAAGNRFYNAAPGANFTAGAIFQYSF
ncbi:MAG: TonB-dependent receptor plug domain-containing protein [Williamsia sp.]|nr:TonB-dependent receptor plug domain-containing protein [Williamsia sp.]